MIDSEATSACERILAANVADVASDLRLINVVDLIGYITSEKSATIEDLVNSASELYFKPGALRYGWSADLDILWEALPAIALNMEFSWRGVTAFFSLRLDFDCGGVDLQNVVCEDVRCHDQIGLRLARALADARLAPPRRLKRGAAL